MFRFELQALVTGVTLLTWVSLCVKVFQLTHIAVSGRVDTPIGGRSSGGYPAPRTESEGGGYHPEGGEELARHRRDL